MKGHIRERGKGTWSIVIYSGKDKDGKKKYDWHKVKGTRKDAERELVKLLHGKNTGSYVEPSRQTLAEYLEQWLQDYARGNVAPRTYEWYCDIVRKHLATALGGHLLTKLTPMQIQGYYTQAQVSGRKDGKGGLSAQSVVYHHRILREALQHALEWGLLVRNPADATKPPRPEKKDVQAFDADEIGQLIAAASAAGSPLLVPLLLAISTGMRMGEILGLKWDEIDLQTGLLTVPRTRAKSGRARVIKVPALLVEAMRRHKASQNRERLAMGGAYVDGGLVYAQPDGKPVTRSSLSHKFAGLVKRAGLPHKKFHATRHSQATLLMGEIPLKVISERLGHSTTQITADLYQHVQPHHQDAAAAHIDQVLRAAVERARHPGGEGLTETPAPDMLQLLDS